MCNVNKTHTGFLCVCVRNLVGLQLEINKNYVPAQINEFTQFITQVARN